MLASHTAVRSNLVRAISLLLLVAVVLSSTPVAAARPGPASASRYEPAPSAALVVTVVGGSTFIPAPIADALVTIHDARSGNRVTYGYTNADAVVDFKMAPGTYRVAIEAANRLPHMSEPFTLESNESHHLVVVMDSAP